MSQNNLAVFESPVSGAIREMSAIIMVHQGVNEVGDRRTGAEVSHADDVGRKRVREQKFPSRSLLCASSSSCSRALLVFMIFTQSTRDE